MKLGGIAFLAAAAAIACAPAPVFAADLSQPMAAPMLAPTLTPTYDWTGGYIGAHIGYGWSNNAAGTTSAFDPPTDPPDLVIPPFSFAGSGLVGGAELGYNWQTSNLVLGVVADLSAANIRGSYTDSSNLFAVDSTINWLSTARLNLGLPMGRALLYATGGLAVGGVTAGLHDTYGPTVLDSSATTTNVGWTVGGGIAAAVRSNWIVKAEYLYVDLGTKNLSFSETSPPGYPLITSSARTTASVLKFSIDYKF